MMGTFVKRRSTIQLLRGKNTTMTTEKKDYVLLEGESLLEYQDQCKGKWYERFVNPVRVKYGDGKTPYIDLPYNNGFLKPFVRLCLTLSIIIIFQIIWLIVFLIVLL